MCGSCARDVMSGAVGLYWGSEYTKSKYHPVGRSHWIVTAENTLTGLSWNPTMEFSPAGPHGGDFLFSTCEQQQTPTASLGREDWYPCSLAFW